MLSDRLADKFGSDYFRNHAFIFPMAVFLSERFRNRIRESSQSDCYNGRSHALFWFSLHSFRTEALLLCVFIYFFSYCTLKLKQFWKKTENLIRSGACQKSKIVKRGTWEKGFRVLKWSFPWVLLPSFSHGSTSFVRFPYRIVIIDSYLFKSISDLRWECPGTSLLVPILPSPFICSENHWNMRFVAI